MMLFVNEGPDHCCKLGIELSRTCEVHPIPGGCGDYLLAYTPEYDEYGIWVHNGLGGSASSWVTIRFCPFCGSPLPDSRRDEWFNRIESLGVEPEDAPEALRAYGWWLRT